MHGGAVELAGAHRRLLSFCSGGEFVAAISSHRSRRKPEIISLAVSITKQYGFRVKWWGRAGDSMIYDRSFLLQEGAPPRRRRMLALVSLFNIQLSNNLRFQHSAPVKNLNGATIFSSTVVAPQIAICRKYTDYSSYDDFSCVSPISLFTLEPRSFLIFSTKEIFSATNEM